jgi:hypothetical protein
MNACDAYDIAAHEDAYAAEAHRDRPLRQALRADILQELTLIVEEAVRRAALKLAEAGELRPMLQAQGDRTVILPRVSAAAVLGAEIAQEALCVLEPHLVSLEETQ